MDTKKSRRTNGEGSLFQSPKNSGIWYAQITLPDGKQPQRKGPSLKQAQAKLKELQRLLEADVNLSEQDPTLWQWWNLWLDHFAGNLKPTTRNEHRAIGRRYVQAKPLIQGKPLGDRRLRALKFAHVQACVNELAQTLDPKTVRNAHARLRKALNVAKRKGYIDKNPAEGVELPAALEIEAEDKKAIHPYTRAQSRIFLEHMRGRRYYALYLLAFTMGPRLNELTGITWDCVDLEAGTITIRQQLVRVAPDNAPPGTPKEWKLLPPKTDAARRTNKLGPVQIEALRWWKREQLEERLVNGKVYQARDPWLKSRGGLVFTTETGAPIHGSDLYHHFQRWTVKAELPLIRFHDIRHTAATLMIANGKPIPAVSKVLGHANVAITMTIYAHALEDDRADAIAELGQQLG